LLVVTVMATVACSSGDSSSDRTSVPTTGDGGADAAAADAAPTPLDPTGGRDDNASSCFAACQNTGFTCQTKGDSTSAALATVELAPDASGCSGVLTTGAATASEKVVSIKLDCLQGLLCRGEAAEAPATDCVPATFSAFSFAYAPTAGGASSVCTRN
jgi:hypothetical protein